MAYTVQNAPFPLKQLNQLYGFVVGGFMFIILSLIRLTQRVEYVGKENLSSSPNHIYAFWHENLPLHFTTNLRMKKPQIWLQHPMLFMKPIHVCVKLMGLTEMAYGSSGNSGKEALERVNTQLRNGYSTMINPDGPAGPIKKLKVGVLIMAKETGVPIIPITMDASPKWVMNTWDKKKQPLPFSRIKIEFHPAIYIRGDFSNADIENLETILSKS
ncbi:MAG: hypothetical protein K9G46_13400 [Flavobacteriales bacterium]|nr:hypothetical protein [Flavobacteriales bacterium]